MDLELRKTMGSSRLYLLPEGISDSVKFQHITVTLETGTPKASSLR